MTLARERQEASALAPPVEPGTSVAAIAGSVTLARGFAASALHCGIRKSRPDLALVAADAACAAAAVFTTNLVQAAPVTLSRAHLVATGGRVRAVVINSGNANACTGEAGTMAARATAEEAARLLHARPEEILVASTGVIGQRLPVEKLLAGLPRAVATLAREAGTAAAEAILTTDTCVKEAAVRVSRPGGAFVIGGMAKGSGMIHPNMATTLAFVTTDAAGEPVRLAACLRAAVEATFNRITVDGDTSTNDMVTLMASGASGVVVRGPAEEAAFLAGLTAVLGDLARRVARDGEGATRLLTVRVGGAPDEAAAAQVARAIAGSMLVKTAVHGADANWGRIAAAAGRAGVPFDPARMSISLGAVRLLGPGYVTEFDEEMARLELLKEEVVIHVDLDAGPGKAEVHGCDLSDGYVRINASYRS